MLRPSPEWKVLLEPFQSLFTKPGYRYFCAFVLVFAHIDQRLWVTQVVLSGLVNRHFTNFYRFLKEGAWNTEAVTQQIWRLSGARCAQGGRLFAAIDDTVVTKSGKKFPALGWHHNPMNKDHPKRLSHGHCFVCLAALSEQVKEHFVALFAAAALYVPEKQTCKEEGWLFATKLELAARLLAGVGTLPEVVVFAVVDGAYARHAFVHPVVAAGCHVVSRLRRDTVFYDLPPVKRKGQKGRPCKFGHKHKASQWADKQTGWKSVTVRLYGKEASLCLKTRVVIQRTLSVRIRLVAVRWGNRPLVFLFCTDTALSAEQIVRAYGARFAIETGFRDAKQSFGFCTYQVRNQASIVRIMHLCLWAQTLLRLRCWGQAPAPVPGAYGDWRKPLSYLTLSQQKRLSQEQCRVFEGSWETVRPAENRQGLPLAA
jgi:hypothetical protein